jgi:hypothetical protein
MLLWALISCLFWTPRYSYEIVVGTSFDANTSVDSLAVERGQASGYAGG